MRIWTAFAKDGFGGYVVVCHDAGIHTAKIHFTNVVVGAYSGFINESSAVTYEKLICGFEGFRYALVSWNKHIVLYGLVELEGRHA
jgi:hypothetical protein